MSLCLVVSNQHSLTESGSKTFYYCLTCSFQSSIRRSMVWRGAGAIHSQQVNQNWLKRYGNEVEYLSPVSKSTFLPLSVGLFLQNGQDDVISDIRWTIGKESWESISGSPGSRCVHSVPSGIVMNSSSTKYSKVGKRMFFIPCLRQRNRARNSIFAPGNVP